MSTEIQTQNERPELWTDFDRTFAELGDRFAEAFGFRPWGSVFPLAARGARAPRLDVTDTGKAYHIVAEVPGVPKDQLDIRIRGTTVEIRGARSTEAGSTTPEYLHRERSYSSFYRALELPQPVVAADAKAKVTDGILDLELPKEHPAPLDGEVKVAVQ